MRRKVNAQIGALGLVIIAAATAAASHGASPGDAEAVATIIAFDSAGIILADLAMTKKLSDPALAFVQDLRGDLADDAEEIADEADDLGVHPARTPAVRALEVECDESVRKLDLLEGPAFEKAYLDATIAGHTSAQATMDRLMQMDLSGGVKGHLKDMRGNFQKHVGRAKALRKG